MSGVRTDQSAVLKAAPLLWCFLALTAILMAFVPTDVQAQYLMAAVALGGVWTFSELTSENPADWRRAAVLIISMFISIRYMSWRVSNTLSFAAEAAGSGQSTLWAVGL